MTKLFDFDHRQIEQNFSNSCKEKFRTRVVNKSCEQAEAEVVPSSSLVELEVEVKVGVWVGAWVKMQFRVLTVAVRWVGGRRNGD